MHDGWTRSRNRLKNNVTLVVLESLEANRECVINVKNRERVD